MAARGQRKENRDPPADQDRPSYRGTKLFFFFITVGFFSFPILLFLVTPEQLLPLNIQNPK